MPLRILPWAIALFGVLMSVGCGSDEPRLADRLTACEVVTASEVASAIGRPVTTPTESAEAATDRLAGRSGCAWSSRDETVAVLVELVRTDDMDRSVRRTGFSATARFRAAEAEHAPGPEEAPVGDRSLYIEGESTLWVLVGDDLAIFEVAVSPTSDARRIAGSLGLRAASRLEQADS